MAGFEEFDFSSPLVDLPSVEMAFAYGSGVFPQGAESRAGKKEEAPMVDYILAVQSPPDWHAANIQQNRHHYSALSYLGPQAVDWVAERIGVGVHFNTLVPWRDRLIKYGVIDVARLTHDLQTWESLYISGRMHKPVRMLIDHSPVNAANQVNLRAALATALLLLPPTFTDEELYTSICGLSYTGDVRMRFAEDRGKVRKIVLGSLPRFVDLYEEPVRRLQLASVPVDSPGGAADGLWRQDDSPTGRASLFHHLPFTLLESIAVAAGHVFPAGTRFHPGELSAILGQTLESTSIQRQNGFITSAIASIVQHSSRRQAVAGFLSAGLLKSAKYFGRKLLKARGGRT
ncbi:hypothetical protein KFL_002010110 [Klebsormidium nitens]|uniref:Phosphatidate cytidylyltransferase, mitochondrial n=1 Tax=Klebsormidium nitens TaxID=105231 RepID=A0A0U9HLV6_KLENI|nr:hypothetical protein KFL_002010110 [Klebsormidium nitens]|eukprot:GAQ84695.1 hypothetical protein KFL_002010110 [Klebsormidium nitens]